MAAETSSVSLFPENAIIFFSKDAGGRSVQEVVHFVQQLGELVMALAEVCVCRRLMVARLSRRWRVLLRLLPVYFNCGANWMRSRESLIS